MENSNFSKSFVTLILIITLFACDTLSWRTKTRLKDREQKALLEFRLAVEDELTNPWMKGNDYLVRWIRTQNYDLEKAKTKLLKSIKWRKDNKIDSIVDEDVSDLFKLCPFSNDGRDKDGRPILTMAIGRCPVRRAVMSGRFEKLQRSFYFAVETTMKLVRDLQASGQLVNSSIVIGDMGGFSMREHVCVHCIPLFLEFLTICDEFYPEYVHEMYSINVPRAFEPIMSLAWPLMSEYFQKIFHVYGYDKEEWQKDILENIDSDQLEPEFGGTKLRKSKTSKKNVDKSNHNFPKELPKSDENPSL